MKKLIIAFMIGLSLTGYSQQKQSVPSDIESVTVFRSKAQINRKVKAQIGKGNTEVILTGLSTQIDPNSIQVSGKGSLTILGIRHERNYLNSQEDNVEIKILRDSLNYYKEEISMIEEQKSIYKKEEELLSSNQVLSGKERGVTVGELNALADFYSNRLTKLASNRRVANKEIGKNEIRKDVIKRQLGELNAYYKKNTSSIIIDVSANQSTTANLEVGYVVYNASWHPLYDIRSAGVDKPIELNYKANIIQNTGVSWKNVRLTLSTANPNLSNVKPEQRQWRLEFEPEYDTYSNAGNKKAKMMRADAPAMEFKYEAEALDEMVVTSADFTETINTTLNRQFEIRIPYTVASGGKQTTVDIRKESIKAEYSYTVVPKLDNDAFLMAKISDWGQYDLLAGSANLFFAGTYVGKTYINPDQTSDTLELSMGRDSHIIIERNVLKDFTSKKLIGGAQKESYGYEIMIKNTKKNAVSLKIVDQIPVSSHKDIEVEILDQGGATFNKVSGELTWDITIEPGASVKKKFSYNIKYPKDKKVRGL